MRKKVAKVVFSMALSFTVAASFAVGSMESKAYGAEARTIEGPHNMKKTEVTRYEEANSEYHFVHRDTTLTCVDEGCNVVITDSEQIGYEMHDLRGVAQAPLRWYCVLCGYAE